jgi:lipid-A-disaccharide synthase-like uncharacterized protein
MELLILGLIGAAVLIVGWLYEAVKEIEHHKSYIDLRFSIIHLIGILFLAAYSIITSDIVFTVLNVILGIIIIFEIVFAMHLVRRHRKSTKRR